VGMYSKDHGCRNRRRKLLTAKKEVKTQIIRDFKEEGAKSTGKEKDGVGDCGTWEILEGLGAKKKQMSELGRQARGGIRS